MADKIRYSISVSPIEEVTEHYGYTNVDQSGVVTAQASKTSEVVATEIQETLGCNSKDIDLSALGGIAAATGGFINGTAHILTSAASATAVVFPTLAACDFLYVQNTGYEQSSAGALQTTTPNTTDYLTIATADTSGLILGILKAGDGMLFPFRGATSTAVLFHRSSVANGVDTGANTLGLKFLAIT